MTIQDLILEYEKKGYVIFPVGFEPDVLDWVVKSAKTRKYTPIFGTVGAPHDANRLESPLTKKSDMAKSFFEGVEGIMKRLDKNLEIKSCSLLQSMPGGEVQDVHRDYDINKVAQAIDKYKSSPATILVSIMPGTKLRVFSMSKDKDEGLVNLGTKKDIVLPVSHCIMFRGDLPHCGLSYDATNFRAHFYVAPPVSSWIQIKRFRSKPRDSCATTAVG